MEERRTSARETPKTPKTATESGNVRNSPRAVHAAVVDRFADELAGYFGFDRHAALVVDHGVQYVTVPVHATRAQRRGRHDRGDDGDRSGLHVQSPAVTRGRSSFLRKISGPLNETFPDEHAADIRATIRPRVCRRRTFPLLLLLPLERHVRNDVA